MESANVDKNTDTELSKNEDAEADIQPPLSVSYLEKSYEQCSPPVCYVELAGHKSAKDQQSLTKSVPNFIPGNKTPDATTLDTIDGASSTPKSGLIIKDDNGECASIISTPPESIVPSSLVQDQKNATTISVLGPLVDASLEDPSEGCLVIVEKDSIDEDVEDRPLVVDLGDSPARSASPTDVKVSEEQACGVFRKPSIPVSRPSLRDTPSPLPSQSPRNSTPATITKTTTMTTPTPTADSTSVMTSSLSHSTSTTIQVTSSQSTPVLVTASNLTPPMTSHSHPPPLATPAPRVQKPIRPFIPSTSHFIPPPPLLEISSSHSSTSVTLASQSTPQFLTSTPSLSGTSTTFRLQPPQLSHSNTQQQPPPPPPVNLSEPAAMRQQHQHQQSSGGNNSNVQFMSVLAPPSQGPGNVQHSPIQLFNLAPLPGYLNPSSGLLFHSIPSAVGGGSSSGGNQPGTFHFAPPPPPPPPTLFASHHHQQQTAFHHQSPPPQQQSFATRSNTPSSVAGSASSLPPPPPLAPAPGLSSLQTRTTGGNSTPMTGVFIPDMNSWMASVTGTQGMIPPLQPIFSCQQPPVPISGAGEPLTFSFPTTTSIPTTATAVTTITLTTPSTSSNHPSSTASNPRPPDPPRPTSTPISMSTTQASDKTSVSVTVNGSTIETLNTSTPPNLSISARRWRPSLASSSSSGKKTSPPTEKSVSKENPVTDEKSISDHSASGTESTIPMTFSDSEKVIIMLEQRKNEEEKESSHEVKEKSETERSKEDEQKSPKKEGKEPKREKSAAVEATIKQISVPSTSEASKSSAHHVSKKKKTPRQSSAPNASIQPQSTTPSTVAPQRKIISHFIDGHVLYESNLPFPVRNATSFVESFLQQCNGGNKPGKDVATDAASSTISLSTESIFATSTTAAVVNNNEREEENEPKQQQQQRIKRPSDGDGLNGGDRVTMTTATTSPRVKVYSSNTGRKRRRLDAETPRTEEEEVKKKSKKSSLVIATPSTSTAPPSQNGHKEHPIATDVSEAKSAASPDVKPATTTAPVPISTTANTVGGGSLKMTIHPVYESSGEKAISKPVLQPPPPPSPPPPSPPLPSQPTISSPSPPTTVSQTPIAVKQTPQPIHHSTPAASSVTTPQSSTSTVPPPPPLPPGPMPKWTPRAVAEFVRGTSGCAPYADAFETNEVDGEALILLSSSTSNFIAPPLSMKIGHALKLANRVKTLTSSSASYPDTTAG